MAPLRKAEALPKHVRAGQTDTLSEQKRRKPVDHLDFCKKKKKKVFHLQYDSLNVISDGNILPLTLQMMHFDIQT